MSSTHRPVRVLLSDDFFSTPEWVTRAILPLVFSSAGKDTSILDPCCGEGAILDAVQAYARNVVGSRRKIPTFGVELDEGRATTAGQRGHAVLHGDALRVPWPQADVIVMNPPFSLAEEFVRKGIEHACARCDHPECRDDLFTPCKRPRICAVLLRLAFLETKKRIALHRAFPSDVYPLAYRPSFTKDGKHDSCAYAWFVWGPGRGGKIKVLDAAPPRKEPSERKPRAPKPKSVPVAVAPSEPHIAVGE